jgi:hypothetical protein
MEACRKFYFAIATAAAAVVGFPLFSDGLMWQHDLLLHNLEVFYKPYHKMTSPSTANHVEHLICPVIVVGSYINVRLA